MILECYQTVEDRENPEYIEKYGPFFCNRTDAWLGDGCYFWDSNIEWAHEWGNGPAFQTNGYVICQAQIRLDEKVFDLMGSVLHRGLFQRAYEALRKQTSSEVTVPKVITAMKKLGKFPYHAIRGFDQPRTAQSVRYNISRPEQLIVGQRVQICLINTNNLLSHTFRIVFPEKYVL